MAVGLKVEVIGLVGQGDEIEQVFVEMASHVHRLEPGCLRYEVGRSRDQPDNFVVWEIYLDQDAFDLHRVTPHFERLMDGRLPGLIDRRERTVLDTVV